MRLPGVNWDTFMEYQSGVHDPDYETKRRRTALWLSQGIMADSPNDNGWTKFKEVEDENGLEMNGYQFTADELHDVWSELEI